LMLDPPSECISKISEAIGWAVRVHKYVKMTRHETDRQRIHNIQ